MVRNQFDDFYAVGLILLALDSADCVTNPKLPTAVCLISPGHWVRGTMETFSSLRTAVLAYSTLRMPTNCVNKNYYD